MSKNKYGFNFLWMFSKMDENAPPKAPALDELDFMAEYSFNFVRIPTDYRFWTKNFDYKNPDESVFENYIDKYLEECTKRNLHMCLNIHRAPGYCINRNDLEKHSLWTDGEAQDGFAFLWEYFAKRYKGISNEKLSFDLLNEPPSEGEYGCTRKNHAEVMRNTIAAIRAIDPGREIVLDGMGGGHQAIPELADTGTIHSGRGYTPFEVSHYKAGWVKLDWDNMPPPVYPGIGWNNKLWNREAIAEAYKPWRDVEDMGVKIHMGEFGCFNKTPNDIAIRWLTDLMDVWKEFGWGYAMWNFKGNFGIIDHGREGARYEKIKGFNVDRDLFDLMLSNRV